MAGPGQARFYSGTFVQTSVASGSLAPGTLQFNVGTTTGAPGTPFVVSVDQNTASEELMLVTNVSGVQYTVTRGFGGTAAVTHNNGAPVVHVMCAQDLTDASAHIGAYDAVHGLSSGSLVVGTTDTQTLTNKTLTSPVINTPTISSPTITGTVSVSTLTATGLVTASDFKASGLTGATAASRYVGATASGAPASGTFATGDFIIDQAGLIWVCTAPGTPGTWSALVNLTATQTLSNKTLASPTLTGTTATGTLNATGVVSASSGFVAPYFSNNGITGATQHAGWAGGTTGGAPTTGTFSTGDMVTDITGNLWICSSGGTPGTWIPSGGSQNLAAVPVSSVAAGTATSGTTDTIDALFGNYQFTAVAGRRYRVKMTGLFGNGSVAADTFAVRIRNSGSASTPTTASTAVVDSLWVCPATTGSGGRTAIEMEDTFIAGGSGTQTLALFVQRVGGTGVFTPVCPTNSSATGARKLWVEDAGLV